MKDNIMDIMSKLRTLKLPAFAQMLQTQISQEPDYVDVPFTERIAELIDAECCARNNARMQRLQKHAGLPIPDACFEDLRMDCPERTLDTHTLNTLKSSHYIHEGQNVIIIGAAGSGKTYISNALAENAIRDGITVLYFTFTDWIHAFQDACRNETDQKFLKDCTKTDLFILDEFLLSSPDEKGILALYHLFQIRHQEKRSSIFCSPYPIGVWYERLGANPVAESLLDRITANSFILEIASTVSMREIFEASTVVGSEELSSLNA